MTENITASMVYEFDPIIYPRKLWIAVTASDLKDKFEDVSKMNDSAYAVVDNVYDYKKYKVGVLIRFESVQR